MRTPLFVVGLAVSAALILAAAGPDQVAVRVLSVEESRHQKLEPSQKEVFEPQSRLTLTLLLEGAPVESATHWGHLSITTAVDEAGNDLRTVGNQSVSPVFGDYVEINREQMWFFSDKKPRDRIKIELPLQASPRASRTLARLEGELKLAATQKAEVTSAPVLGLVGKPIDDPSLTAAGLGLRVTKARGVPGDLVTLAATDPKDALLELKVVDTGGKTVSSGNMSFGSSGQKDITLLGEKPLPAGARLRFVVATERREVTVPIRLSGVALP